MAGLKAPEYVAGISLVPVLKDTSKQVRETAYTQYNTGYSIRGKRYRYTEWGEQGAQGVEFYDHESDPEELNNLASSPEHASKIREWEDKLQARITEATRTPEGLQQVPDFKRSGNKTSTTFAPK